MRCCTCSGAAASGACCPRSLPKWRGPRDTGAQRLPHGVAVSTAEVTERKGSLQALERCKPNLKRVQSVLCDSGYVGQPFAQGVRDTLGQHVTVQIAKRSELHTFKVMPKRWIVERSFAWLEKNRRLWKNCERWLSTSLQFIHLAFLALLLKRL